VKRVTEGRECLTGVWVTAEVSEESYRGPWVFANTKVNVNTACKHEEASTQRGVQHCIQTPRATGDEISHSIDMQA
jgi:hypothetical protein